MKELLSIVGSSIKRQVGGTAEYHTVEENIATIIQAVLGVLGIVAVVFIIIGGINYMTSQGEPGKTKKARDTILYAVIGLIVALLAFAIVTFILSNIKKAGS